MPVRLGGALLAEFIGTFALCFIGVMAVHQALILNHGDMSPAGLVLVALAFGLVVAVIVTATLQTSGGHLNPAVTLGFLVTGKIKPVAAAAYIGTQLVASVVACLAVYVILGADRAAAAEVLKATPDFSAYG